MNTFPEADDQTAVLETAFPLNLNASIGRGDGSVALAHDKENRQMSLDAAIAVEKLAKRAETTALAVIAAEAIVAMALSSVAAVPGSLSETAQETLLVAQKAAAKTLRVAKEDAEETLMMAQEVARELLAEAQRKGAGNA
jgi:hypothetical protein